MRDLELFYQVQSHTVHWEMFKAQKFQGLVPFVNKFFRMAIWLSLVIKKQCIFCIITI